MQGLLRKRAVVGLDLGAGAVKAVEWTQGSLRSWAFAPLSAQAANGGDTDDGAIRKALRDGAPAAARAVVGLNADQVLIHPFRLPGDLPPAEVEEQARIQAVQAAPYPVTDACYDYRCEGARDTQANYRMGIARSAVVRTLCRQVEEAGLKVAAVDITSLAVQRALARSLAAPSTHNGVWAVLDGGYKATRLSVYSEGGLAFQHSQSFGCRQLARRLSVALGLTPADTRKAIEECSVPGGAVGPVREVFLEDLTRHAARALQLYLSSRHDAPAPERLFFWGGAALVHGACERLGNVLAVPVQVADPMRRNGGGRNAPDCAPVLLGAYALALNDHA